MAIAVPGEVRGLYTVWKKYGKLPWATLVEPSIKLARYGFPLPPPVEVAMTRSIKKIKADPGLRYILCVYLIVVGLLDTLYLLAIIIYQPRRYLSSCSQKSSKTNQNLLHVR